LSEMCKSYEIYDCDKGNEIEPWLVNLIQESSFEDLRWFF